MSVEQYYTLLKKLVLLVYVLSPCFPNSTQVKPSSSEVSISKKIWGSRVLFVF